MTKLSAAEYLLITVITVIIIIIIIIITCKGWELRPSVHCQRFQFYWNLNHPPPPSSCQEEVGFQRLQKHQTAQISPKRNVQIRFVLFCQPKEIFIWTSTMKYYQYKQFERSNWILGAKCWAKTRSHKLWESFATSFPDWNPDLPLAHDELAQSTGPASEIPNWLPILQEKYRTDRVPGIYDNLPAQYTHVCAQRMQTMIISIFGGREAWYLIALRGFGSWRHCRFPWDNS